MSSTQHNLLFKIAALQQFDGSFNLDGQFATTIGLNLSAIMQESQIKSWNPKAWATTLAIAVFIQQLDSLKDDWELIADKSKIWLIDNFASQLDDMFNIATTKYVLKK